MIIISIIIVSANSTSTTVTIIVTTSSIITTMIALLLLIISITIFNLLWLRVLLFTSGPSGEVLSNRGDGVQGFSSFKAFRVQGLRFRARAQGNLKPETLDPEP